MKFKEKLVSIVMPAYNCERYIETAINSVFNQTYSNWELIIVNDCSTDNTEKIIKKYLKKDRRIKYKKLEKNSGAAIARNNAVEMSKGVYLAFLDSDDTWFPKKLEMQIKFMEDNGYGFTCTSYIKIDEDGTDLNRTIYAKKQSDYHGILKTCPGNSTVIYNAEKIGKITITNIKKRNDYVMWLQVIKAEGNLFGINEPLSSHRITNNSISSNKLSLISYHWEVYQKIEKLSFVYSCYLIMYWIIMTIFKLR